MSFSILIGGEVGGVVGLIFAVPIVAIIKTTLKQIFDQIQSREIEDDQNKMEEQWNKKYWRLEFDKSLNDEI